MAPGNGLGPFRPGSGVLPPYLAGREAEQSRFRALLGALAHGVPPPAEVVLHGPRGNGKTALLAWLEDAAAAFPEIDVVFTDPSEISTRTDLAERLLSESWRRRLSPDEISLSGLTWRPGKGPPPSSREVLSVRAGRKPLLLLLDEAHTLTPQVGNTLLNASQSVRRRMPLLLVLAGTPGLREHLNRMSASFWNRCEPLPIGRLESDAAAEAIRRPLREEGIGISEEALDHLLSESHGYPFFLQLWGRAVWERVSAAVGGGRRVGAAEAEAAQADFDFRRDIYYRDRYNELRSSRLLPVGRAVADAFETAPLLDDRQLEAALRRGLAGRPGAKEVAEAEETLYRLGYIWQPAAEAKWEPGIPSLMEYIRDNTPALR